MRGSRRYCHLTASRVLMYAGYFEAAAQEIDRAEPQLSSLRDLAQLWYGRGNLEQEVVRGPRHLGHHKQAAAAFERSLELSVASQSMAFVVNIHLNLAFSLAEIGRLDEAERHLADAALLDQKGKYSNQRVQLAARIAYRRGNFSLASSLNEQAYPKIAEDDERIQVCMMQARIALAMNDLPSAERLGTARGG